MSSSSSEGCSPESKPQLWNGLEPTQEKIEEKGDNPEISLRTRLVPIKLVVVMIPVVTGGLFGLLGCCGVPAFVRICNILAPGASVVLNLSPILTIRAVNTEKRVGNLPLMPYTSMISSSFIWTIYGTLLNAPSVYGCNVVGIATGLYCFYIFTRWCPRQAPTLPGSVKSHVSVSFMFATSILLLAFLPWIPKSLSVRVVGYIAVVLYIVMMASPLAVLALVMKTKCAKAIPLPFAILSTLMGQAWIAVGLHVLNDICVWLPAALGLLSGLAQIVLKLYYGNGIQQSNNMEETVDSERPSPTPPNDIQRHFQHAMIESSPASRNIIPLILPGLPSPALRMLDLQHPHASAKKERPIEKNHKQISLLEEMLAVDQYSLFSLVHAVTPASLPKQSRATAACPIRRRQLIVHRLSIPMLEETDVCGMNSIDDVEECRELDHSYNFDDERSSEEHTETAFGSRLSIPTLEETCMCSMNSIDELHALENVEKCVELNHSYIFDQDVLSDEQSDTAFESKDEWSNNGEFNYSIQTISHVHLIPEEVQCLQWQRSLSI